MAQARSAFEKALHTSPLLRQQAMPRSLPHAPERETRV